MAPGGPGWLAGSDLVLMAEEPELVNNAQMASVPGHPLWRAAMRLLLRNAAAGVRDPLYATGPRVITAALRVSGSVEPGSAGPTRETLTRKHHWQHSYLPPTC